MQERSGGSPPSSPSTRAPARRLVLPVAVLTGVALVATSVANWRTFTLECEAGALVAYRGLPLPLGQRALPVERFGPVTVAPHECRRVVVGSLGALERAQTDATVRKIDAAIDSKDPSQLEAAASTIEALLVPNPGGNAPLEDRKRALLLARFRADLKLAKGALERAHSRMRAAEQAGFSAEALSEIRDELRDVVRRPVQDAPPASETEPSESQEPGPKYGERSL